MSTLSESRHHVTRPDSNLTRVVEPIVNEGSLDSAIISDSPFPFFVAENQLPAKFQDALEQDFPRYRGAGFFPYDPEDCGPKVNALIEQLTSAEFGNAVGRRLGVPDLGKYPTLVSLSRLLNKSHGTIHTDSRSKVVTALMYLNRDWPQTSDGCLRFLAKIDDIDDLVGPEVRPVYGNFAAFRRADNSFHGHLPYQGERRVIQIAWVTSEEEKLRKTKQGRFSKALKKVAGFVDKIFGSNRDRSASHGK